MTKLFMAASFDAENKLAASQFNYTMITESIEIHMD